MKSRRIFLVIVLIMVLSAVAAYWGHRFEQASRSPIKISYQCDNRRSIEASFYRGETKTSAEPDKPPTPGGSATVTLSDGRILNLKQTISADGVRYANADDSFVLWSKGNGALVLENNIEKSYIGCIMVAQEPSGSKLPQIYHNSQMGFSLRLPDGYKIDESYTYQPAADKKISGVKFTVPEETATGTNLASDSYLSVELIPRAQKCSADLFLIAPNVVAKEIEENGTTYSFASSTDAGLGNRYEETIYALPGINPCLGIRYFVHYGVFENYAPGMVHEFNKNTLLKQLDQIRRTLVTVH